MTTALRDKLRPRKSPCHLDITITSAIKNHRLITQDKPNYRHLDDSSTLLSTPELLPRSPRLNSPSLYNDVALVTKSRRRRRNLTHINYYELEQNDAAQSRSDHLVPSSIPDTALRTDQDSIGWEHFIRCRLSLSFTPIITDYYRANKLRRRFTAKKWFTAVITSLFDIHQQAWIDFYSATTRTSSTSNIYSPKKTLLCLVEKYDQLSGNLQKLQKQWFARPTNSFTSWTVDKLRYWLRTAKIILSKKKLTPSSQSKELKQYTILADKNRNSDSTHRLHRILPVQPLHNFKNTPLSRFFPYLAAGTDRNNLIPTNQPATNYPTNSLGTFSTLTSSERLRDPISLFHQKSQLRNFRMYDIYLNLFLYLKN